MSNLPSKFQVLFSTFPPAAGDVQAQLAAYAIAIEGHDIRDIDEAIEQFVKGAVEGHNPSFAPSASLVGATIRGCMIARLDSERRARKPALPPPDVEKTPESRERVRLMAQNLIDQLATQSRTDDAAKLASRKRWQDRVDSRFNPSQDEREMARRLGFTAGDRDGQEDAA